MNDSITVSNGTIPEQADLAEARRSMKDVLTTVERSAPAPSSEARSRDNKSKEEPSVNLGHWHRCYNCNLPGNNAADCRRRTTDSRKKTNAQIAGMNSLGERDHLWHTLETANGLINGKWIQVFRDIGVTTNMV